MKAGFTSDAGSIVHMKLTFFKSNGMRRTDGFTLVTLRAVGGIMQNLHFDQLTFRIGTPSAS